jgi:hypothetical protein
VGEFVKTGKLDFRDLVTSMIADLAKLAARRFILGPIANALSGALGGAGGIFANILHAGGMVGAGPGRMVPAHGLCQCPAHAQWWLGRDQARRGAGDPATGRAGSVAPGSGRLRPAGASTVNVTINARDAELPQSRTQVAATSPARCPGSEGCDGVS